MNILIDYLPTSFVINNKTYEFNCGFRESIIFTLMMQDDSLTDEEKILGALKLYYPIIPKDTEKALEKIYWFYSKGNIEEDNKKVKQGKRIFKRNNKKAYDFEVDSDLIFTAFMSQYNINLNKENLHWWEFLALFNSLNDDNEIVKIMNYRTIDLTSIEDKKERKMYSDLQKYYSLEDRISKEEQELLNKKRAEWG